MHRILIVVMLAGLLIGCKNVEKLGAGNELAMENQTNIEKNVLRLLNNFEKLAKAQPNWTGEDAVIFSDQKATIIEQMTINYAWLLVIKEAVEANDLDPKFFGEVLERAPGWIGEGKKIYDLIKEMANRKG